jgi:hypothetical protein
MACSDSYRSCANLSAASCSCKVCSTLDEQHAETPSPCMPGWLGPYLSHLAVDCTTAAALLSAVQAANLRAVAEHKTCARHYIMPKYPGGSSIRPVYAACTMRFTVVAGAAAAICCTLRQPASVACRIPKAGQNCRNGQYWVLQRIPCTHCMHKPCKHITPCVNQPPYLCGNIPASCCARDKCMHVRTTCRLLSKSITTVQALRLQYILRHA